MRYKIKDIPPEGVLLELPLTQDLLRQALDGTDADLANCSGSVRLELSRTGYDVVVYGTLNAMLTLPCGGCLKPTTSLLSVPIKTVFTLADEGGADELSDDALDDDADVAHHDGISLDLEPTVRELLILSVPMAPRCRENCLGLCVVCGGDRNETACGHSQAPVDVRFAPLKDLKIQS